MKRKDRFDEDLGVFVGVLDESSIFKSLHSILESKEVTPEEVCTQNVDGALREWFFHGREVFEMRREQMKEIARRADLPCRTLDDDYDFRVAEWKQKYVPHAGRTFKAEVWYKKKLRGRPVSDLRDIRAVIVSNPSVTHLEERLAVLDRAIADAELDEFSVPESLSLSHTTETSQLTEPVSEKSVLCEPVSDESVLCERVVSILGKPQFAEYPIISSVLGEGDLLYIFDNAVALVIECKRVVGRPSSYKQKVKEQAIKYAKVVEVLRPDARS